jgi:predicted PurR-regulated permease PerM
VKEVTRVHVDVATAVRLVTATVLTLAVVLGLDRARHLVAWLLTAAALALVLDGPVRILSRFMQRAWALALVTSAALAALGGTGYVVTDRLIEEYQRLQRATPDAARQLAEGLGLDRADSARFVERVVQLVEEGPRRLLGSPRDVTEGALSRLAIFAIVVTLAVFLLASSTRALHRAAVLIARTHPDVSTTQAGVGLLRGAQAARRRLAHVAVVGVLVAVAGSLVDLPGAQPLGLWAAMWRLLPLLGALAAYAPFFSLLLLTADTSQALVAGAVVVAADCALSWWTRRLAGDSPPPMRTVAAVSLIAGFELYGAVGALVAFVLGQAAAGAVAVLLAERPGAVPVEPGGRAPQP